MKHLLLALLLASCARTQAKVPVEPRLGELKLKAELYKSLSTTDENGWILTGDCDGLLHNALAYLGGIVNYIDLKKAEQEPGRWTRTPQGDCLSSGRSKSSISRDMLLGVLLAATHAGDSKSLDDLLTYANAHDYIMGESDGSLDGKWRTTMTPTFYNSTRVARNFVQSNLFVTQELVGEVDFTDHLQALLYLLAARTNGGMTNYGLSYLEWLTKNDPNNALYQAVLARYTDGNQVKAIDILLNEELFPADRLPTSDDRCAPYLWMHGENDKDWLPCEGGEHPGHDLLLVAHVIFWGP